MIERITQIPTRTFIYTLIIIIIQKICDQFLSLSLSLLWLLLLFQGQQVVIKWNASGLHVRIANKLFIGKKIPSSIVKARESL